MKLELTPQQPLAVVEAVAAQLAQFTHTCFTVAPYDSYIEVAEALNRVTPGDHAKRTALFNSGAEAVENAVKIARHYTGRQAVVAFDHAYHGRTTLTMGLTAKNLPYKNGFGPFAAEIYRAPLSYPFRDGGLDGVGNPMFVAADRLDVAQGCCQGDHIGAQIEAGCGGRGGRHDKQSIRRVLTASRTLT